MCVHGSESLWNWHTCSRIEGLLGSGDAVETVSVKRVTMALRCCGVSKPRGAQVLILQEGGLCLLLLGKWLSLLSLAGAVSKLVGVEEPPQGQWPGPGCFPTKEHLFSRTFHTVFLPLGRP